MQINSHLIDTKDDSLSIEIEGETLRVSQLTRNKLARYLRLTFYLVFALFSLGWLAMWLWLVDHSDPLAWVGAAGGAFFLLIAILILHSNWKYTRVVRRCFQLREGDCKKYKKYTKIVITITIGAYTTLEAAIKPRKGFKRVFFGYLFFDDLHEARERADALRAFLAEHSSLEIEIKERQQLSDGGGGGGDSGAGD